MSINYTFADFTRDAPVAGASGIAAATEKVVAFGLTLNEVVLWAGVVYGLGRVALLALEAYWKWKDRQNGSRQ